MGWVVHKAMGHGHTHMNLPFKLRTVPPPLPHTSCHERAGSGETAIPIKVPGCQRHQVINLLVVNVNWDLLTQPIEHALN